MELFIEPEILIDYSFKEIWEEEEATHPDNWIIEKCLNYEVTIKKIEMTFPDGSFIDMTKELNDWAKTHIKHKLETDSNFSQLAKLVSKTDDKEKNPLYKVFSFKTWGKITWERTYPRGTKLDKILSDMKNVLYEYVIIKITKDKYDIIYSNIVLDRIKQSLIKDYFENLKK